MRVTELIKLLTAMKNDFGDKSVQIECNDKHYSVDDVFWIDDPKSTFIEIQTKPLEN